MKRIATQHQNVLKKNRLLKSMCQNLNKLINALSGFSAHLSYPLTIFQAVK